MKKVLQNSNGGRVVINTETDVKLYDSPCNPPNTGTKYTRGTDLYYHKTRKGNKYYYFLHWSIWQGSEDSVELIDFDAAEQFLLEKAGNCGYDSLSEKDISNLKEFGFDLFVETD